MLKEGCGGLQPGILNPSPIWLHSQWGWGELISLLTLNESGGLYKNMGWRVENNGFRGVIHGDIRAAIPQTKSGIAGGNRSAQCGGVLGSQNVYLGGLGNCPWDLRHWGIV